MGWAVRGVGVVEMALQLLSTNATSVPLNESRAVRMAKGSRRGEHQRSTGSSLRFPVLWTGLFLSLKNGLSLTKF